MHGIGNDYVYINCFAETVEDPAALARFVSDRHTGVGSDGLILIRPSQVADFEMAMYNADGSRAQMCGNGIRCVGKYVHDKGLTDKTTVTVETLAGIKTLQLHLENGQVASVTVDMGEPILDPAAIPVAAEGETFVAQPVTVDGADYEMTCVSMGNPHAIVFVDAPETLDLEKIGPSFENHPLFPERTNTEFVRVEDDGTLTMRVWERGAGETMACGTGACAVLVAAVLNGKCKTENTVHLLGGDLEIQWNRQNNHIFMTGPATFVFDGTLFI
jgi:diaminopimelate epimerase